MGHLSGYPFTEAAPAPGDEPCPTCGARPDDYPNDHCPQCRGITDPPVAVPGPASVSPADTPEAVSDHLAVTFQCPSCDGDGYNDHWLEDSEGRDFPISVPCERCGGTGELRDDGEDDPDA